MYFQSATAQSVKFRYKSSHLDVSKQVNPGIRHGEFLQNALGGPAAAEWMRDNYRNVEIDFIGYGGHYIQEDNPQAIGRGIVEWHRRTFD